MLGKTIQLCTPHPNYLALGSTDENRQQAYRDLFSDYVDKSFIEEIRAATNRGLVVGSDKFKNDIESMLNYSVHPNPIGRPARFDN